MSLSLTKYELLPSEKEFGLTLGFFFTLNVIIGAGFLSLPHVFQTSGWVFSSVFLLFSGFQSYYLGLLMLEVMSRASAIEELKETGERVEIPSFKNIVLGPPIESSFRMRPSLSDRRMDVCLLANILLGKNIWYIYSLSFYLSLIGTLSIYSAVFASSLAEIIPLKVLPKCRIYDTSYFGDTCYFNYWFFLLIFTIITTILVIEGLKEQKWFQTLMSVLRFFTIFAILTVSIFLITSEVEIDSDQYREPEMPIAIDVDKIGGSLTRILFAFAFQVQFPSICEFIKDRERNLKQIIFWVCGTCILLYFMLGFFVSIAIPEVEPLATLNFHSFSAGYAQADRPWWTYIVSYFIILFPAVDVLSCFTLSGAATSDNFVSLFYGATNSSSVPRNNLTIIRLVISLLPNLIAFFVYDLEHIMKWVGLLAFVPISLFMPLMVISARQILPEPGPFDVKFAPKWFLLGMVGLTMLFIILTLIYNG